MMSPKFEMLSSSSATLQPSVLLHNELFCPPHPHRRAHCHHPPVRYPSLARFYSTEAPQKPIGGFRGGLSGFLIGITIACGTGYYYLIDEYHVASSLLLNSVEELQASTNRVRDYARKIETVDKELKKITRICRDGRAARRVKERDEEAIRWPPYSAFGAEDACLGNRARCS
ncbi:hypothetical protein BC938DRAFT_473689 [Jimgerdemannia flammicorona]|uniref:Uncharacterized protein n=1 Tax=Jimgerdemannia flammicorona TaxID=994334 RepID=A0A433Q3I1_9FUNG|nr:hypothetical protein BC938DRAFT_473689 [Jimgerdemannia flammicorona]